MDTNPDIDNDLSNNFWTNPAITDSQKTAILKFRTGQYMGNARKQLLFGIERFPSITCPICNSTTLTPGSTYFLNAIITTYMQLELKDITKQYGHFAN